MKRLSGKDMVKALQDQTEASAASKDATGTGNPLVPVKAGEFEGMGLIRLRVMDVDPYDRNPRREANPQYAEIKESIKTRGLDQQLSVTKRPGATRYNLARGGKTRLQALQELFNEGEKRFEFIDFVLVEYKSDTELITAHMIENVSREAMSFFDTAAGFMELHAQMQKDMKREISFRDLSKELNTLGLVVNFGKLSVYGFCLEYFKDFRYHNQLNFRLLQDEIRPLFSAIKALQTVLFPGQLATELDIKIRTAIAEFEATEDVVALLKFALLDVAGGHLSLTREQLIRAVDDYNKNNEITRDELLTLVNEKQDTASVSSDVQGDDSESNGNADTEAGAETAYIPPAFGGVQFGHFQRDSSPIESARTADVRVLAPGESSRTPRAGTQSGAHDGTKPGEQDQRQGALPGLSAQETAHERFKAALIKLARFSSVESLMLKADLLRYGYYMEIPKTGSIGNEPTDYSVLGWWFLAMFSGQFLQANEFANNMRRVPDTGEGGLLHALFDGEGGWEKACVEKLGGKAFFDPGSLFAILSNPNNAMAEHVLDFLTAIREYNKHLPDQEWGKFL